MYNKREKVIISCLFSYLNNILKGLIEMKFMKPIAMAFSLTLFLSAGLDLSARPPVEAIVSGVKVTSDVKSSSCLKEISRIKLNTGVAKSGGSVSPCVNRASTGGENGTLSGKCGDHITWSLNQETGTLTLTGSGDMPDFSYDYYDKNLSGWVYDKSSHQFTSDKVKKVVFNGTITSIGKYAFYSCRNLKSIEIPATVKRIGEGAFSGCGMTSVNIPASVTSIENPLDIGAYARDVEYDIYFDYSVMLKKINVDAGNPYYSSTGNVLFNKDKTRLIYAVSLEKGAYTIPDTVTSIANDAFCGKRNLTRVVIPHSVKRIGSDAFSHTSLTKVVIPDSVTIIESKAFYACEFLTNVVIPKSVQGIGYDAFYYYFSYYDEDQIFYEPVSNIYYEGTEQEWNAIKTHSSYNEEEGRDVYSDNEYSFREEYEDSTIRYNFNSSEAASITRYPVDQTVAKDSPVTLSLEARGNGLTYQWYYRKKTDSVFHEWKGRTHASETFTPDDSWNKALLYCVVKDSAGNTDISDTVTISLVSGVVITKQPQNIITKANKQVNLSVTAIGKNLSYQWYYKKKGGSAFNLWKGYTQATIQPPANNSWDGMQVRCLITDSDGNKLYSNAVTITLLPYASDDFQITTQPKSVSIDKANVGSQSVSFSVKVKNGSGVKYQWYFCKAGQSTFSAWNGHTSAAETVKPNATWDGIMLYCQITNGDGEQLYSDIAKVTFTQSAPSITKQPTNQTINLGSPVTLSLTATGSGLTYQWYFKKSGQTSFTAWNGRTHATETVTPNATWNGIQLYCIVKDSAGNKAQSNTVTVKVNSAGITITQQPKNQSIIAGKSLTLTLKATGSSLKYQWYFKKKGQTSFSVWNGRTHASETVSPNNTWDGIQLYCKITDSSGSALNSNTVSVSVLSITTQPVNVAVAAGKNATFKVKATGSGLNYQWQYKKTGATSWSNWNGRTTASTTATANSTWNGMKVRCIVTDGAGNKVTSSTATITIK